VNVRAKTFSEFLWSGAVFVGAALGLCVVRVLMPQAIVI
jgi:hypothetical protein